MSDVESCAGCGRADERCICGQKREHYACLWCEGDVHKDAAVYDSEDPNKMPFHQDCLLACAAAGGEKSTGVNGVAPETGIMPPKHRIVIDFPVKILVESPPDKMNEAIKLKLVEIFAALQFAAERCHPEYNTISGNVSLHNFSKLLSIAMGPTPGADNANRLVN